MYNHYNPYLRRQREVDHLTNSYLFICVSPLFLTDYDI